MSFPTPAMSIRRTLFLFVAVLLALPACGTQARATSTETALPATETFTPSPTATATDTPTVTPTIPPTSPAPVATTPPAVPLAETPGLLISGYVKLQDGAGLAGVQICRNYASYNGTVVATTDATGFFQSDFAYIPGDETIGVWPVAPGYTFDPPSYSWRHYYGPEERPLDFMASPGTTTATPPAPCP